MHTYQETGAGTGEAPRPGCHGSNRETTPQTRWKASTGPKVVL